MSYSTSLIQQPLQYDGTCRVSRFPFGPDSPGMLRSVFCNFFLLLALAVPLALWGAWRMHGLGVSGGPP